MSKNSMWSAPLRHSLHEPSDAAALARIRAEVLERSAPSRSRRASWSPRVAVIVAACAFVLGVTLLVRSRVADPARLLTNEGAEFTRIEGKNGGESVLFTDGSRLAVERGASVVGLASTPNEFAVLLERGRVDVEVTPGGPRRWIVEAKWARIEVVGTRFSVEREAERVRVNVREGVVVVRGASLPEGVARVTAGQSVEVRGRGEGSSERAARVGPGPDPSRELSRSAAEVPAEIVGKEPKDADFRDVAKKETSAFETADRLFERADDARARGQWREAETLLERLVREHPAHPRAALAAYTLGVVLVRQGKKHEAVNAFELVLQLAPSRSLREDALLRLVETELARGAREHADERAREYRAWFPAGRHLGAIERLEKEQGTP